MVVDLQVTSEEYFGNLNTTSKKMFVDIQSTQEAYQDFWHSLSKEDQHQVIDESIIFPSAVIRYAHLPTPVIKDNPNIHSWFTKSQLDLFNQNLCTLKTSAYGGNLEKNELEQSKKVAYNQILLTNQGKEISGDKTMTNKMQKPSILKPRIPPPPPPPIKNRIWSTEIKSSDNCSELSTLTDIPKTGFDFLDNW